MALLAFLFFTLKNNNTHNPHFHHYHHHLPPFFFISLSVEGHGIAVAPWRLAFTIIIIYNFSSLQSTLPLLPLHHRYYISSPISIYTLSFPFSSYHIFPISRSKVTGTTTIRSGQGRMWVWRILISPAAGSKPSSSSHLHIHNYSSLLPHLLQHPYICN